MCVCVCVCARARMCVVCGKRVVERPFRHPLLSSAVYANSANLSLSLSLSLSLLRVYVCVGCRLSLWDLDFGVWGLGDRSGFTRSK